MSHDDDARGAVKGLSFPSYLSNQVAEVQQSILDMKII